MRYLILLLAITLWACNSPKKTISGEKNEKISQPVQKIDNTGNKNNTKNSIIQKYGLIFSKPKSWKTQFEDISSVNLKGEIMALETAYKDTMHNADIHLVFHPEKKGVALYNYQMKNLKKGGKLIKIDGKQAIEKTEILRYNGKGIPLNPPLIRHKINLLVNNGEVEIIFTESEKDDTIYQEFISKLKTSTCNK